MCVISNHVNNYVRHRRGRTPQNNRALQAFVAAHLLRERVLGINTIAAAAICAGVSRPYVKSALLVLQSGNTELASHILRGHETLLGAAKKVRGRVKLIESFKAATAEDRIAFGNAVGIATVFDTVIEPAL